LIIIFEQLFSFATAKLRKVGRKTKELILFFCRDGVSSRSESAKLRKNERNTKGKLAFLFICEREAPSAEPADEDVSLFFYMPQAIVFCGMIYCEKYLRFAFGEKQSTAFRVEKRYFNHRKAVLFCP